MRDINVVAIECMRELDVIGIQYGNVVEFKVNYRAERRWGQCCPLPGGRFSININHRLLDESTDIDGLKNTLIHELLHTCKGCLNHGSEWKRLADKVNRYYGYGIKRTSSADEKGIDESNRYVKVKRINHKYVCCGCGQTITRQRETGFVNRYKCGRCGSAFEKIF